MLSYIWVKSESNLSQISTRLLTSHNQSWYAHNTFIQTLWKQIEINDKFAAQIIEVLCNKAWHHNKISLVKCEEHENHLYFWERKYMFNSDKLCLCIIQLAHDNVINDHSERAKSYELISWVYWWLNIYKYI